MMMMIIMMMMMMMMMVMMMIMMMGGDNDVYGDEGGGGICFDADADGNAGFWSIDVMEHYQWPEERLSPDTKCTYCNLRIIIIFDEAEEHDDDRPIYIFGKKLREKGQKLVLTMLSKWKQIHRESSV